MDMGFPKDSVVNVQQVGDKNWRLQKRAELRHGEPDLEAAVGTDPEDVGGRSRSSLPAPAVDGARQQAFTHLEAVATPSKRGSP
jgi:hypothetical protein